MIKVRDLNKTEEDSTEAVNLHSPTPINSIITTIPTIPTIVVIIILQKTPQGLIFRTKTEVMETTETITNLINSTIIKIMTIKIIMLQIKIL
jgi:hypothetical protein